MNFVDPIRDRKKITQIKNMLLGAQRYRDLLLLVMGMNTALRISDLLTLQLGQVVDDQGDIRRNFAIKEEKRGKRNVVTLNASMQQALDHYLAAYEGVLASPNYFLFFSARRSTPVFTKPMSRKHAEHLISEMCQAVGLTGNYGTHTLRKTWG